MKNINPEKREEVLISIAEKMCIAARTAPKAKGEDSIITCIILASELKQLQDEMRRIAHSGGPDTLLRDADNIEGHTVVLIGTKLKEFSSNFSLDLTDYQKKLLSAAIDLGIAIGSAVSIASDSRVDNRVMLSIGEAAVNLKILGEDVIIAYGIPLSISGKNPFFDRRVK